MGWRLPPTAILGRSYWIPGSYTPALSEKHNSFLRLLKKKGFREERMTKFGLYAIGKTTTLESNKSLNQMDPQWYRPSKMEDNPLAWMIMVDGFVVDVRRMSRTVQEIAYEKGLIPYIPGEK
jgi:hypothetical protein